MAHKNASEPVDKAGERLRQFEQAREQQLPEQGESEAKADKNKEGKSSGKDHQKDNDTE